MTGPTIFRIIISKFSYRKKSGPIILFVIDKNLKIDPHHTVLILGLAISLRIESNEEPLLDPKEVALQ